MQRCLTLRAARWVAAVAALPGDPVSVGELEESESI